MKRTKNLLIVLLAVVCITAFSMPALLSYASSDVIFEDAMADDTKMLEKSDGITYIEDIGWYRSSEDKTSYILYQIPEDIGDIELTASIFGGFDGYEYAEAVGADSYRLTVQVATAKDGEFKTVATSAVDTGETMQGGARTVIRLTNISDIPKNMRFLKLTTDCAEGCGYFIGLTNVKIYANDSTEESNVILEDPCTNLGLISKKEGDIYCNSTFGFSRYISMDTAAIYYATQDDIGNFAFEVNIYGDYNGYLAAEGTSTYSFQILVADSEDGPYSIVETVVKDTGKTLEDGVRAVLSVTNKNPIDVGQRYIKFVFNNSGATYFVGVNHVLLSKGTDSEVIPVESVQITNHENTLTDGETLEFQAEKHPQNATYYLYTWKVYDDSNCTVESDGMWFDASVLYSDYGGIEDRTVYVVAELGGVKSNPFPVSVYAKPDAQKITISGNSLVNEGDSFVLTAQITPLNANSTDILWEIFNDEACTEKSDLASIDEGVFTAQTLTGEEDIFVYVRASVLARKQNVYIRSEVLKVQICKLNVLLNDNCTSLAFVDQTLTQPDTFEIKQDMILRKYPTDAYMQDLQYCVLGEGSSRTDHEKQGIRSLYYKTYGDIASYRIDAAMSDYNKDAHLPSAKPYFGYILEVFVSTDGNEWIYIPSDYEVVGKVNDTLDENANSLLTFYNKSPLPENIRHIRIDILGQFGFGETNTGTSEDPKYSYTAYFGVPLSENTDPNFTRDKIAVFYNTYAPFIAGVKLVADPDTEIDDTTIALSVPGIGLQIRKGETYTLGLMEVRANNSDEFVPVTDFSDVTYQILEGNGLVNFQDGSGILTVAESFAGEMKKVRFKIAKGDAVSEIIELNVVIPISDVKISGKTTAMSGDEIQFQAIYSPSDATFTTISWYTNNSDAVISASGIFTAQNPGEYDVWCVIDGITSPKLQVKVEKGREDLRITIDDSTIIAGEDIALTANFEDVTWTILKGQEIAFLEDDMLKTRASGEVVISAQYGEEIVTKTITVEKSVEESNKGCGSHIASSYATTGAICTIIMTTLLFCRKKSTIS